MGSLLSELDVLAGFADLAVSAPTPYVRPTMLPAAAGAVQRDGSGIITTHLQKASCS